MATTSTTDQPLLDTKKNSIIHRYKILFFALPLIAVILLVPFFVPHELKISHSDSHPSVSSNICNRAYDPKECSRFFSEVASNELPQKNGRILLQKFLKNYVQHLYNATLVAKGIKNQINDKNKQGPLEDCLELMDLSVDLVMDSVIALASSTRKSLVDAQTWLSAVLTNHVTCIDGLNGSSRRLLGNVTEDLMARARASLAILAEVAAPNEEMLQPLKGKLPSWVTKKDRKLLESTARNIKPDLVVAQDGEGDYKTVSEAILAAPDKSKQRFVIHVKLGTYEENVEVTKKKKNLMIIGDGMDLTIITGSLNVVDGSSTFRSATLAAVGEGFILQDICIQNTAGPEKHQAVALRVGADKSVINRCAIDAFQDTLYTHSHRQFYRDCLVRGTIDFIFGNAAVVIQRSRLEAKKPMKSQKNMLTAQGRTDPNQNTGTSIQNCEILPSDDLEPVKNKTKSYLGRPWKEYAKVVVMQSYIDDHIDPAGWAEWSGDFALKTLYYGEFMNQGPGAGTSKRVDWTGYHVITDPAEAMKFTVGELIQGGEWLESTGVEYKEGLTD